MERFPHLNLIQKIQGSARLYGGGKASKQSQDNIDNRVAHSSYLTAQTNAIESFWDGTIQKRKEEGLPELDPNIIPLYLQVDKNFDIEDAFKSFNIEVISEENEGFVIGASLDKLHGLKNKIDVFTKEQGQSKDKAAQLWQIIDGTKWRVENILSSEYADAQIGGFDREACHRRGQSRRLLVRYKPRDPKQRFCVLRNSQSSVPL